MKNVKKSENKNSLIHDWQFISLVFLIATGICLEIFGIVDLNKYLEIAKSFSDQYWLPIVLISIQAFLFAFALPGSSLIWLIAPLYTPLVTTLYICIGTTTGALMAYTIARKMQSPTVRHAQQQAVFTLLKNQGSFLTLFALRVFPGVPHSIINYSCGILKVSVTAFIFSTILGSSIKTYLYAKIVHDTLASHNLVDNVSWQNLVPLAVISLLAVLGKYFWEYVNKHKRGGDFK